MSTLTEEILSLAGMRRRDLVDLATPSERVYDLPGICFDWSGDVGEFPCEPIIGFDAQAMARAAFQEAVRLLYSRVPLVIRALDGTSLVRPIAEGQLGAITETGRLKSASSPAAPRIMRFAANWTSVDTTRLAAVILHESVHQLLYRREAEQSPVRPRSIAYSPWKVTERPGRLVWHAFWTFAVQLAFLLETPDDWCNGVDQSAGELANMLARLECCRSSLNTFNIIEFCDENARIDEAVELLLAVADPGSAGRGLSGCLLSARDGAEMDFRSWAAKLIAAQRAAVQRKF